MNDHQFLGSSETESHVLGVLGVNFFQVLLLVTNHNFLRSEALVAVIAEEK